MLPLCWNNSWDLQSVVLIVSGLVSTRVLFSEDFALRVELFLVVTLASPSHLVFTCVLYQHLSLKELEPLKAPRASDMLQPFCPLHVSLVWQLNKDKRPNEFPLEQRLLGEKILINFGIMANLCFCFDLCRSQIKCNLGSINNICSMLLISEGKSFDYQSPTNKICLQ